MASSRELAKLRARKGAPSLDEPFSLNSKPVIAEIIGRDVANSPFWSVAMRYPTTVDKFRADYRFWDELRNCKATGYELSGLFCRPITQILASYIMGKPPTYTLVEQSDEEDSPIAHTNEMIERFIKRNHAQLVTLVEDLHGLGDQFVIVNPDGSLSVPSPDTVDVEFERWNPRRMQKVTVTTKVHGVTVKEVYTADARVVTMREGAAVRTEVWENLTGRLPVVAFANNKRGNELFGRPEYEAMLPLLSDYDDLLDKAIQGARVMGNPIPVMEGMENIEETIAANAASDESYTDSSGVAQTRERVNFDTNGIVFIGKGGKFELKAPPRGFTEDMRAMLRQLFELVIDHVRIPELVYGTALGGNRASAETQIGPFVRFLDGKRAMLDGKGADKSLMVEAEGGMYELVDVWLRTKRLTDSRIVVDAVRAQWPVIDLADENVKLQKVIYAHGINAIDREETLGQLNLVPNPPDSVARAMEEKEEDQMMQDAYMTQLNRAAKQDMSGSGSAMLKKSAPPDPDGGRNVPFADGFVGELDYSKGISA